MAKVIGIDLGTTNSCVAVMEGDGPTMVYAGNAVEALEEYRAAGPKKSSG